MTTARTCTRGNDNARARARVSKPLYVYVCVLTFDACGWCITTVYVRGGGCCFQNYARGIIVRIIRFRGDD